MCYVPACPWYLLLISRLSARKYLRSSMPPSTEFCQVAKSEEVNWPVARRSQSPKKIKKKIIKLNGESKDDERHSRGRFVENLFLEGFTVRRNYRPGSSHVINGTHIPSPLPTPSIVTNNLIFRVILKNIVPLCFAKHVRSVFAKAETVTLGPYT